MKKLLFFGLGMLLMSGMASCQDDAINAGDNNQEVPGIAETYYLGVNIAEALGTRATDFDNGSEVENQVKSIHLVFYDFNGDRISAVQMNNATQPNQPTIPPVGEGQSVNSIYQKVVTVDVKHGMGVPSYVLAFINPITQQDFATSDDFKTLSGVETLTRTRIVANDGSFAMSKSAYYDVDPLSGTQTKVRLMATPILSSMLYTSESDALEALNSNDDSKRLDIYVERYAAKVTFSLKEQALTNSYTISVGKQHTLKFIPEYWAVNNYEFDTYVTKSFFEFTESLSGDLEFNFNKVADFDYVNKYMGNWTWNDEANHRSYWAQSPAYYAQAYPRVSDDIMDADIYDASANEGTEEKKGGYALNYYSYNDLVKNAAGENKLIRKARKFGSNGQIDDEYQSIYVRENTVAGEALIKAYNNALMSPKAAIGSVLLVGRYTLDGKEIEEGETFYIIGNNQDDFELYETEKDMRDYFMGRLTLAKNASGTPIDRKDYDKYFDIKHPDKEVRNEYVMDSRFVTLQLLNDILDSDDDLYIFLNNKWVKISADNINTINWNIMSACGIARGFNNGRAYFNIPIQHLGYYRSTNDNYINGLNATSKEFDWTKVKSGDFGIVRNHSYSIEASSIKGLGNAIPDPNVPIVPPTDPEENYVGIRILVLNWKIVPNQSVDL